MRDAAAGAAVRGAIGGLVGALGAVPTRRLALFDLLPRAYRDGTVVPEAVVALGPALDAAADEAERYAERCRAYAREVADALDDGQR